MSKSISQSAKLPLEADTATKQYRGDDRLHTDADGIRREYGIPAYDREAYREYKHHVWPNLLEHYWNGEPRGATRDKGGTDVLISGKPGSGKSNLLNYVSTRLMEVNGEAVVWRASTARSEWLPLAPWARVCLPAGVSYEWTLQPKNPRQEVIEDVSPEQVAREVIRYDDIRDLNQNYLEPGMFHVVYPDPTMTGAQAIYERAQEKTYDGLEFSESDPSKHWWFAWVLDRVKSGPYFWTTWVADEIGDLAPQSAQKDAHATYQKVEMLKDCYVDARKTGLTMAAAGHNEVDIHAMVRRKIRWRLQMPGSANPTRKTDCVGFDSIPMDTDMTSDMMPGEFLVYNERNFDDLKLGHMPAPIPHKLQATPEVVE